MLSLKLGTFIHFRICPFLQTMNLDEMLALQNKTRHKPKDDEHRLQVACVRWFSLQYPKLRNVLFAVPNGGRRDAVTGARLKAEGATAGVADLILLKCNRFYGALCLEMKTSAGRQSNEQKQWQKDAEANGQKYVVCRSLDDFMREINTYLDDC